MTAHSSQNSLTRSTLIHLSIWISAVLILSTLLSYMHVVSNLENQTIQHLQNYIAERGQRESQVFYQTQTQHRIFKRQLLAALPQQSLSNAVDELLPIYSRVWSSDAHLAQFYAILNDKLRVSFNPQQSPALSRIELTHAISLPVAQTNDNAASQSLWHDFNYDGFHDSWALSYQSAIWQNGQRLAYLGSELLLDNFVESILSNYLPYSYNLVFSRDGQLIVHPEYMQQIKTQPAFSVAMTKDAYLQEIHRNVLEAPFIGDATVINHSHENDYIAVTQIADLNWYLVTIYPKKIVRNQAFVTAFFILILGLVALLTVIAVLSVVLRTQVAAPLNQLIEATQQITEGNLNLQIDTQRHDELGQLATAFNEMAREIESREMGFKNIQKTLQQEILERKQMEKALRASEERFNLAMQGSNDGIMDWQILSDTVYFSPRWKAIIGYADAELADEWSVWEQHIHPEDRELVQHALQNYIKKQSASYEVTFRMQHKQGEWIWILARGIALWNAHEQAVRLVATHADISEQKQAEKLLRDYNAQLNEEVRLRTQEAEQAWLAAERANRAKSIFLANMSHELRTPLNSISGYAQLLSRDQQLTQHYRDKILIIQRSGDYLLTLINDILDLAKIEAGRIDIEPVEFEFDEFLQGINDLFYIRAEQNNIAYKFMQLTPLPKGLYADERRLRQILINLIGNAVKFTSEGAVIFKVGYEHQHFRFQIEDSGIGIAEIDKDKIFQPFQQTGESDYKQQGTGLGLAITKKLVEVMGGQLDFHSQLGKGSTFWVTLALPEATGLKQTITHSPEQSIMGYAESTKTLLLVDNHADSRRLLNDLLQPLGFRILHAETGKQALDLAEVQQPDLILLELSLPHLDGYALTKYLKKSATTQHIPLIALSASVFDYHQEAALDAGCNSFIAKPLQVDAILKVLQTQLNLTWHYADDENTAEHAPATPQDILPPASQDIAVLYDLAMRGDIAGITEYAEQLTAQQPELAGFTDKVIQLAKAFDDEKICELLENYQQTTQT